MKKKILDYYNQNPLTLILIVALIIRLFSVIFAKGYGMHDDHFLIIETSRSWAQGMDFQHWLPNGQGNNAIPQGHSFTYPLLMFLLFKFLNFIHITSLDTQMYFVRLLHALFSLLTIFFSYKITMKATKNKHLSNIVGWALCLLWCMPWLSVRNLVEITCIPFILWATYIYIRHEKPTIKDAFLSGMVMALGFSFRFQLIFFIGGFGLAMLIYKQWKQALVWTVALLIVFSLTQISDVFLWHRPFAEMQEYIMYNFTHSGDYITGGFFEYFGVLLLLLMPPISVFLLFGFFYGYKRLFLFLPAFCFLIFHSIFPNKQERFIFPIMPFVLLLGVVGINDFFTKHPNMSKIKKTIRVCTIISLVFNFILLIPVTIHYSKRARVEAMVYLHHYQNQTKAYLVEGVPVESAPMLPRTYMGSDAKQFNIDSDTIDVSKQSYTPIPDFVLFVSNKDLSKRLSTMKKKYPNLAYETTVMPSPIDNIMCKINRHNKNYPIIIYRNTDLIKTSLSNK
jgi:hypothetical protein